MSQRIAVVGAGISGLVSAYLLSQRYEVHLFEVNNYLGGHTRTIELTTDGENLNLDCGFIVFNHKTYPHFTKLLARENVETEASEMSFSYASQSNNFQYNGHSLKSLFADRKNLYSKTFYGFLIEIMKFNYRAKRNLGRTSLNLADYLAKHPHNHLFYRAYLIPMLSAIWSCDAKQVLNFPLYFLFGFLENHGLLDIFARPQWYVLKNGSKSYIAPLIKNFRDRIYTNTPVRKVIRQLNGVTLLTDNDSINFDKVLFATHSDQTLALLAAPTEQEIAILGAIPYQSNEVTLHQDTTVLPSLPAAWASWNYTDVGDNQCKLTYYLNRLQNLTTKQEFCVSVNLSERIAKDKILQQFTFSHPVYSQAALKAQQQFSDINGKNHSHFAGAYWGYGFHEDGVVSAMNACAPLNVTL